jgi:hypothetical protein
MFVIVEQYPRNRGLRGITTNMTAMGKFKHTLLIFACLITAANGKLKSFPYVGFAL